MLKNFKYILLTLAVISPFSWSKSICENCKISGVQPDPRRSGTYIFIDGDLSIQGAECSNTASMKAYFIPENSVEQKTVISVALAALMSDRSVDYLHGNGVCDANGYEAIDYFKLK